MKVSIIGSVGIPAKYGGFETLAEYLTKYLASRYEITVYCSGKSYERRPSQYHNANLKYIPLQANGSQSILYDIVSIFNALQYADILLILGVSGCIILPFIKLISKKKIIVNIDGLEWKRAKWGRAAKWFLKYSERLAVKNADIVIADNKVIKEYVQKTYGISSAYIPYGGDHAKMVNITPQILEEYPFLEQPYAFKVCRIEPENNVSMILEAFVEFNKLNLVMVGNWESSDYGRLLKAKFQKYSMIHLLDPIYDQPILDQLRSNCKIYIHGHSAGGTNPSLVESMYLKLPVIAFGVNYNKETTANRALYFNNKEELVAVLANLNDTKIQLAACEMKKIADQKYSWDIVTNQYASLF